MCFVDFVVSGSAELFVSMRVLLSCVCVYDVGMQVRVYVSYIRMHTRCHKALCDSQRCGQAFKVHSLQRKKLIRKNNCE